MRQPIDFLPGEEAHGEGRLDRLRGAARGRRAPLQYGQSNLNSKPRK
jgi:hypothetical protein